jgi:hypothetical protein
VNVDLGLVAAQSRSGYPRIVDAPKEAVAANLAQHRRAGAETSLVDFAALHELALGTKCEVPECPLL